MFGINYCKKINGTIIFDDAISFLDKFIEKLILFNELIYSSTVGLSNKTSRLMQDNKKQTVVCVKVNIGQHISFTKTFFIKGGLTKWFPWQHIPS